MSSFNFIGMPGAKSSATDYSYLISQLDIKENQLASDGNLSPGDYDLLTKMARAAYTNPGLTPDQRSQLNVKISGYAKDKSTSALANQSNITNLNDGVADDLRTATMVQGNDPEKFLQTNADTLSLKLSSLKDAIDNADASGADDSVLTNEFGSALEQYNDVTSALQDVKTYKANPSGQPSSDFAAYITTNPKGQITDVQIGRQGAITGYSEVKALYGGLPIYGKLNQKAQGNDIFKLGNKTYSAPSFYYDPNNPNAKAILVDQSQSQGNYSNASNIPYVDMDTNSTQPQGFIPDDGWAQGNTTSTFYHNDGGGKYTKYVNASPDALNIPTGGFIPIPKSLEQSLAPSVGTTTDLSAPLIPPVAPASTPSSTPPTAAAIPPTPSAPGPASFGGTDGKGGTAPLARTQAAVTRAPSSVGGIASAAINGASNFLGRLFNKPGQ